MLAPGLFCSLRQAVLPVVARRLAQVRKPLNYGNSKGRPCPWLLRSLGTTATVQGSYRKIDYEAAYDRIVKKRERQEKSKDKHGKRVVEIWQGMSLTELARVLQRPIDSLFEIMLYVEGAEKYDEPKACVDDLKILEDIVMRAGFRPNRIKSPALTVMQAVQQTMKDSALDVKPRPPPDPAVLVPRCPIVTVMGHVDHGKTTLLDALRNTSVVEQEFGGITQHIGAFSVQLPNSSQTVTFLDTPGHAAFYAMRSRGAHITDIVVLVVAADDGVMEQTKESIRFANEAKVPIIVAINKCDKPDLDMAAVKKGLWSQNIALEEFGGEIQSVQVSALKRTGLEDLVEAILTQAELMQLKADPTGPVEAVVVESRTDVVRGRLCTAIVQRGTLQKGACLVAGTSWARVRGMFNDKGQPLQSAPPGVPVEVLGWRDLPSAGDAIFQCDNEQAAQSVIRYRQAQEMEERMNQDEVAIRQQRDAHLKTYKADLEKRRTLGVRRRIRKRGVMPTKEGGDYTGPKVALVVKADVDGSLEAILDVLETYTSPQCKLDLIHYGVGNVTEGDLNLAEPFKGIVYAFNVQSPADIKKLAKERKIEIRNFNIIYRLVEDLKKQMDAQLPTQEVEEQVGVASVLQNFVVKEGSKKLSVAGSRCVKGTLDRKLRFKALRGEEVLYDGVLTSMRHLKNEVNKVEKDKECGLGFGIPDLEFQLGDTIICYTTKSVKQTIHWNPPGF